jgi:hypothetical protein
LEISDDCEDSYMKILVLRGGLGNQLFQFAASVSASREDPLVIWTSTGEPRKTDNLVDLGHFSLPSTVSLSDGPKDKFSKKILSWNLVLGIRSLKSRKSKYFAKVSNIIGCIYFSLRTVGFITLFAGKGVGFYPSNPNPRHLILNGYFQAEYWAKQPKVNAILQNLRLTNSSEKLKYWVDIIKIEKPIIIHIRLGDYRLEDGIGILQPEYFLRALSNSIMKDCSENVWIFSDEPASIEIKKYVPSNYRATVFTDISLSPAETLELMRYGKGYVISNSSFSWWAAYLSYNQRSPRILPNPWFKNQESPIGIKPGDWNEIDEPF